MQRQSALPALILAACAGVAGGFSSLTRFSVGGASIAPRVPLHSRTGGRLPAAAAQIPSSLPRRSPITVQAPAMPTLPNQPLPMVEICANGQVMRYSSTLTSIRWMFGANKLAARDVRLLRSSAPVLAPREGYMLFDFGELRGILQADRLTLIGADRPAVAALGEEIQRRLEQDKLEGGAAEEQQPFEVRALECMLEQVYTVVEETLQRLSVLVSSTLAELTNPSSFDSEGRREAALGRLLPLRISLSSLETRARRVSVLLDELLDSEEDISDMCLTHLQRLDAPSTALSFLGEEAVAEGERLRGRAGAEGALLGAEADESAEEEVAHMSAAEAEAREVAAAEAEAEEAEAAQEQMEELLDVYDARFNSLCDQIEQLGSTIENTQDVLELTLDNERNRIARLELLLSMAGLSVGSCSAVSGFFGMNLLSGVENMAGLFVFVTGTSILLTGSLFVTCWRQFRSISRRQRDRLMDVDALKNVLANLDIVALLLRNRPPLPRGRKAMQVELRELLESSGIPILKTKRELSVLCSLLMQQQQVQEQMQGNQQGLQVLGAM